MRLYSLLSGLIISFIFCCTLEAAQLSASIKQLSVKQAQLKQGVSFVLTLELDGGNDDLVKAEPDFSSLSSSFTLVETRRGSFADFVDGGVKTGIRWQLTLKSKASGKLEIPAISLGLLVSEVISIEVAADAEISGGDNSVKPIIERQTVAGNQVLIDPKTAGDRLLYSSLWSWLLAILAAAVFFTYWRQCLCFSKGLCIRAGSSNKNLGYFIRLRRSCRANDPHDTKVILLAWWNSNRRGAMVNSLAQLAQQVEHHKLSLAIMSLDRCLYAQAQSQLWLGNELWLGFKSYQRLVRQKAASQQSILPPLYPRR